MDTGGGPDSSPQRPCFPQHPSPPSPGAPTGLLEAPGFSWVVPMAAAGGGGCGGRGEGRERQGQLRADAILQRGSPRCLQRLGAGPQLGLNHQG